MEGQDHHTKIPPAEATPNDSATPLPPLKSAIPYSLRGRNLLMAGCGQQGASVRPMLAGLTASRKRKTNRLASSSVRFAKTRAMVFLRPHVEKGRAVDWVGEVAEDL